LTTPAALPLETRVAPRDLRPKMTVVVSGRAYEVLGTPYPHLPGKTAVTVRDAVRGQLRIVLDENRTYEIR